MKALRSAPLAAAIAIAAFAFPSAVAAEYYVPPGNSAADQYTEAFPTAGGDRDAGKGGKQQSRSPSEVLGGRNARELEEQGPEGQAVAEIVTATAPEVDVAPTAGTGPGGKSEPGNQGAPTRAASRDESRQIPDGSSGLGEILGQATGSSSSGQLGLLLPLLILATLAWALAYLWRERNKPTP